MSESFIDSPKNPRVRSWIRLRERKHRDDTQTFLVEGERETLRIAETCEVVSFIMREDRTDIAPQPTVVVSDRVFDALSTRQNPDGIAAVLRTPDLRIDSLAAARVVLIADGIEKPGNIGAMIRTADAFGAGFLGASLGTDLFNHNVIRAAQGSLLASPQASVDRDEARTWATADRRVIVATPSADTVLWDADLAGPTAIVVGAEAEGVHASWLESSDTVRIPTTGRADSLNASVSAAVMLAESVRQASG